MWLFTKHGFYSAVCARTGDRRHGQPLDADRIVVRARVREHLNALKDRFPHLLGQCEIMGDVGQTTRSASSSRSGRGVTW